MDLPQDGSQEDDENPDIMMEDFNGPTLDDFVNDEEIRRAYNDPEVANAFREIEEDPSKIAQHHNNEKIQKVLQLIQDKFEPYLPKYPPNPPTEDDILGGLIGGSMANILRQMGLHNMEGLLSGQMPEIGAQMAAGIAGLGQSVNLQALLDMFGQKNMGERGPQSFGGGQ